MNILAMKKLFGGGEKKQHHQRPAQQQAVDFDREIRGQTVRCNHHAVSIEGRLAEGRIFHNWKINLEMSVMVLGGFALVYLVKDVKNGRYYALKKQFVNDSKTLDACKREIQIIKTLAGHPNIVCYVDSEVKAMREEGVYECQMLTKFYKSTHFDLHIN